MAKCKFCGREIIWAKDGRRMTPVDSLGDIHRCEEMQRSKESLKSLTPETLTPEEVKKYEEAINNRVKK